ncbi:HAMP domain-containing sensor histidine kinase [Sphaerisporangium sp. TRM90804]|uniref:HAMP domain-containing sensor histidine kinase n=1 Tax=Sphaerisporangium sp. TRM90804 TaxID=3031113 RepID=UPI00244D24B3|nr:HAMP domain-containing sensor histidine kinase [Sphaerisporangium sp. TRM90804]MDH2428977.1 HAMP domain-containing sensor histidine kinase [Sphaerisporangium sp. TRM90804]
MKRTGLRTRVTAGFTVSALTLSAAMALVSYQLTRDLLIEERERTIARAATSDADVVREGLDGDKPDVAQILRTLDTGENRLSVLHRDGTWYAVDAGVDVGTAIPRTLRDFAQPGRAAMQRTHANGRPALVVAIPLSASTTFYQIGSLEELESTLYLLSVSLTAVAIMTAAAGAALGWYTTRYALRPLTAVADAAESITAGGYGTRLDPTTEPDLERLTTSFNQMVDELSQRLRRDRRFAADVSHELRSPLQTLSAATSVLTRRREHLDARTATAAHLVAAEVTRFQALVTDLLELARSDQPVERGPVDVADLARQACRSRGLPDSLVTVDAGIDVTWHVDRRRVTQLLGNLLDNAVRYAGGPTSVRIGATAGTCFLDVDDQGPGVTDDDKQIIFGRFVRGRNANARGNTDGTGLGLALVTRHAHAHGGRVTVHDRPGGGARFHVELPVCTP